jgi:hypothetical protein
MRLMKIALGGDGGCPPFAGDALEIGRGPLLCISFRQRDGFYRSPNPIDAWFRCRRRGFALRTQHRRLNVIRLGNVALAQIWCKSDGAVSGSVPDAASA